MYTFRKFCGEHRGWTDEANNAEIEEFSHNQVEEEGDIPCRDAVTNQDRMPGDSWLSEDSCNICTCTGINTHIHIHFLNTRMTFKMIYQEKISMSSRGIVNMSSGNRLIGVSEEVFARCRIMLSCLWRQNVNTLSVIRWDSR